MKNKKLFIFGIDGATWDVLDPLMAQGSLPHMSKLIAEGRKGILLSSIPPDTATAWTTFQTGVNPGKHGIFDFNQYTAGSYSPTLINSEKIPQETIWQVLSRHRKRLLVLNVPVTYPPYPINGRMVCGLLTPSLRSNFTFPEELAQEILSIEKDYTIITTQQVFNRTSLARFIEKLILTERKRTKVMHHLLQRGNWDVAMIHFQSTDPLQHAAFCYLDKAHPLFDPDKYHTAAKLYTSIDDNLGRLLDELPSDSIKVVLSDHGFASVYKTIHLNNFFIDQGLMTLKKSGIRSQSFLPALKTVRSIDQRFIRGLFSFRRGASLRAKVKLDRFVDWPRTKASMMSGWLYGLVYLNCRDREQEGIVRMGKEYEELRESIGQKLLSLEDPDTHKTVIKKVHKREELYEGKRLKSAPDLVVIPEDGYEFSRSFLGKSKDVIKRNVLRKDHMGVHKREGIFAFSGITIDRKSTLNEAHIVDMFPTILFALGIPIPDYTDGKILSDLFTENFKTNNPPVYEAQKEASDKSKKTDVFSEDDKKKIEKRLKDLGYM
jgi:predicted AlkP superfamily phosphohydrolase/phosphomutase